MKKVLCLVLVLIFALSCSVCSLAADNKYGDLNSDSKINSEDALVILRYSVGLVDFTAEQKKAADVSADSEINSLDALLVLEYSVGLIKSFPAEESVTPESMTVEQIVALYNSAANKTKAYKGTMNLDVTEGATSKITKTSFPNAAKNIANSMLPNDYPTKTVYTIENGTDKKTGESINTILPIIGSDKMSTLDAGGVASASCAEKDGKYEITIKLKPETVNSLSKKPAAHTSCMEILSISEEDLEPFTMQKCEIKYLGGTIKAVINSNDMLDSYDANNPIYVSGTVKWTAVKGTAEIDAKWQQTVLFTY